MNINLYYNDVTLIPKYSELESRSDADTSVTFGNRTFKLPITPANMQSVIDEKWAMWLSENGYFYIMHRFEGATLRLVRKANIENWRTISISVGVNDESLLELNQIKNEKSRVDYITIDVAHGHHLKVKNMISFLKENFKDSFIIAGNTTTPSATIELERWGADATKCGIGSGMACSTKFKTGFHIPSFSSVLECANVAKRPIIADGGITHYGDIAKALVAGASMVMCGGLFASCSDSPAPRAEDGGKLYFGNASERAKGVCKNVEGFELSLPADVTLKQKLVDIKEAIQSSISYGGGKDLSCFNTVDYVTLK